MPAGVSSPWNTASDRAPASSPSSAGCSAGTSRCSALQRLHPTAERLEVGTEQHRARLLEPVDEVARHQVVGLQPVPLPGQTRFEQSLERSPKRFVQHLPVLPQRGPPAIQSSQANTSSNGRRLFTSLSWLTSESGAPWSRAWKTRPLMSSAVTASPIAMVS